MIFLNTQYIEQNPEQRKGNCLTTKSSKQRYARTKPLRVLDSEDQPNENALAPDDNLRPNAISTPANLQTRQDAH